MRTNQRLMLVAAVVATVGAGCASAVRQPEVSLAGVRVGGIGLRGGTILAVVEIKNPNDFTLETDSITYDLEATDPKGNGAWSRVTQGTYAQRITVKDGGKTEVEVPIEFNYTGLGGALRGIMDKGTFNYRVQGKVFVREPLRRTIPFTKSGNLSLAGAR